MLRRPPRSTLFPTRRSSDLARAPRVVVPADHRLGLCGHVAALAIYWARSRHLSPQRRARFGYAFEVFGGSDRKSTRLNSSHPSISYAVFCLKKKKNYSSTDI